MTRDIDQLGITLQESPLKIELVGNKDWFSSELYLPAVPGVLVALVGLWIAHHLARSRERRKEISERCDALRLAAETAADCALAAWACPKGAKRKEKIHLTKRKFQIVGIIATDVAKRTRLRIQSNTINLAQEVADFRRASTKDPFEDPSRRGSHKHDGEIGNALANFIAALTSLFSERYP